MTTEVSMKRMFQTIAATLLLAMLSGAPAYAQAIYGCANPTTHKVRRIMTSPPTCKATETPLSWSEVGPQGPPGPQGLPGPGVVVKDANGVVLGNSLTSIRFRDFLYGFDINPFAVTFRQEGTRVVGLPISDSGNLGTYQTTS